MSTRPQTNDLSPSGGYGLSQVTPQTYSRPASDPNAGARLQELAQGFMGLRPGIQGLLANQYNASEFDTAQKAKLRKEEEHALGIKAYIANRDLIHAGIKSEVDKTGWSLWRTQGYEMTGGQFAAQDFRDEVASALLPLANKEGTTPEKVDSVISETRKKYMAMADGQGPAWLATFNQYASPLESGLRYNTLNQVAQTKLVGLNHDAASHITTMVTAALASPDQLSAAKQTQDYVEKTIVPVIGGANANAAVHTGYMAAVQNALASHKLDQASQLIENFQHIDTPHGKISDIDGGQTLKTMLAEYTYAVRNENATAGERKDAARAAIHSDLWDLISPNLKLPPDQWPDQSEALGRVLKRATEFGMESSIQEEYDSFHYKGLAEKERSFGVERTEAARDFAVLQSRILENQGTLTESQLNEYAAQAHELAKTPAGASVAGDTFKLIAAAKTGFSDNAEFRPPLIADTISRMDSALKSTINIETAALKQRVATAGDDTPNLMSKIMGVHSKKPYQFSVDPSGNLQMDNLSLQDDARAEFQSGLNALRGDRQWKDITREEIQGVRDKVMENYTNQIKENVKAFEKVVAPAVAAGKTDSVFKDVTPALATKGVGYTEVNRILNKVSNVTSRSVLDGVFANKATGSGFYSGAGAMATGNTSLDNALAYNPQGMHPFTWLIQSGMSAKDATDTISYYRGTFAKTAAEIEAKPEFSVLLKQLDAGLIDPTNFDLVTKNPGAGNPEALMLLKWAEARRGYARIVQQEGVLGYREALSHPPSWTAGDGNVPTMTFYYSDIPTLKKSLPALQKHYGWTQDEESLFIIQQLKYMTEEKSINATDIAREFPRKSPGKP